MDIGRVVIALVLAAVGALGTVWALGLYTAPAWVLVLVAAAWAALTAWVLAAVEARAYGRWRERADERFDRAVEALNR